MSERCEYCAGEPEPGWIEMPNNGPIVRCPRCNPEPDDYTKALNEVANRALRKSVRVIHKAQRPSGSE